MLREKWIPAFSKNAQPTFIDSFVQKIIMLTFNLAAPISSLSNMRQLVEKDLRFVCIVFRLCRDELMLEHGEVDSCLLWGAWRQSERNYETLHPFFIRRRLRRNIILYNRSSLIKKYRNRKLFWIRFFPLEQGFSHYLLGFVNEIYWFLRCNGNQTPKNFVITDDLIHSWRRIRQKFSHHNPSCAFTNYHSSDDILSCAPEIYLEILECASRLMFHDALLLLYISRLLN